MTLSVPDVIISDHGSLWFIKPLTAAAERWLDEHVCGEQQWFGGALAAEPRYVEELVEGMVDDGLEVV